LDGIAEAKRRSLVEILPVWMPQLALIYMPETFHLATVCTLHILQIFNHLKHSTTYFQGHSIAQEVNSRLPVAAAQIRTQVRSCGICGGQSVTGNYSPSSFLSHSHSTNSSIFIQRQHTLLLLKESSNKQVTGINSSNTEFVSNNIVT
jgi:hypothetical protein